MATEKIVDPNRGTRNVLIVLGACCYLPVLFILNDNSLDTIIASCMPILAGCVIILMGIITMPKVILDYEGVTIQIFRKKTYLWKDILQAGRYYSNRKEPAAMFFRLVLVLPGGSLKRPGEDFSFLERNCFKAAVMPNEPNILEFIRARYGQLDFDDYDQVSEFDKKIHHLDQTQ